MLTGLIQCLKDQAVSASPVSILTLRGKGLWLSLKTRTLRCSLVKDLVQSQSWQVEELGLESMSQILESALLTTRDGVHWHRAVGQIGPTGSDKPHLHRAMRNVADTAGCFLPIRSASCEQRGCSGVGGGAVCQAEAV